MSDSYELISTTEENTVLVLTLAVDSIRDYDRSNALEKELVSAVANADSKDVIVDFGSLAFMSSVGYLPFVGLRSTIERCGGRLVLCNQSPMIRELFDSTRLLINSRSPKAPFNYADSLAEAHTLLAEQTPE